MKMMYVFRASLLFSINIQIQKIDKSEKNVKKTIDNNKSNLILDWLD